MEGFEAVILAEIDNRRRALTDDAIERRIQRVALRVAGKLWIELHARLFQTIAITGEPLLTAPVGRKVFQERDPSMPAREQMLRRQHSLLVVIGHDAVDALV